MKAIEQAVALMTLTLVLLVVAGCSGSSSNKAGGRQARRPLVLSLANYESDPEELARLTEDVARLSGGALRINVKSVDPLPDEDGVIAYVRGGKADLGAVGTRAWDSVGVTSLRALSAPLLIDSYALQDRVLRSRVIPEMLMELRPLGLVGMGVLPGPLRKPVGISRPLVRPSDYIGAQIGVQQSRVADATMRVLGATPARFPAGGPIARFDGIEQEIISLEGNRYYPVAKNLTANVTLWPRPVVIFANDRAFAALTRAQQGILRQALAAAVPSETKVIRNAERQEGAADLCHGGLVRFLTASSANIAALRRAVQPVYNQLERDPQTRRFIERIAALRREVTPEPAPRCARSLGHLSAPGPIDGIYRFSITAAQAPAGIAPENYGAFTLVIDRGRFASTQENKLACTWQLGTVVVKGDKLEQLFKAAGGIAPTGANNKPGEFFVWRWSLYRDKLKLMPISPTNLPTLTWTRISTSPSRRYLSERCPPPAKALPR